MIAKDIHWVRELADEAMQRAEQLQVTVDEGRPIDQKIRLHVLDLDAVVHLLKEAVQ